MKKSTTIGALGGVALIAAATLFAAAPAQAATIVVDLPDTLPAEADFDSYPAGWFSGDRGSSTGTLVQQANGLIISGGSNGYLLLNGDPDQAGSTLTIEQALAASIESVGDVSFQIPVFADGEGGQFTTIRPAGFGSPNGTWVTSQDVPGLEAHPNTAPPTYTTEQVLAAIPSADVLAFGVLVYNELEGAVRSITIGGDTYLFAAAPTITAAPGTLAVDQLDTPVTLTASGFLPGETVVFSLGTGNAGGDIGTAVADASGVATFAYTLEGDFTVGDTYTFSAGGAGFFASVPFEITAAAAAPAAPVLAATGAEVSPWLVATAALLALGGTGAVVFARRAAKKA